MPFLKLHLKKNKKNENRIDENRTDEQKNEEFLDEEDETHKKRKTEVKFKVGDNEPEIGTSADTEEVEYEIVEREILPEKIICPDCGGITLKGLEFCDKCGGEL